MAIIENTTLIGMSGNTELVKAFPILKKLKNKTVAASCCGKGSTTPTINFNEIKAYFATLPQSSVAILKQLTGWTDIRVTYAVGNKVRTKVL